jgi:hypothetical protein
LHFGKIKNMAVQKKTYTRAIAVIPSDNNDIPNPALQILSGVSNSSTSNFQLVGDIVFENLGIQPGDIVYNLTQQTAATVVLPPFSNLIDLNADIFTVGSCSFIIFAGTQNDASKGGCVIYSGTGGNFIADTLGNDQISLVGIPSGQIVPVQVKKVYATGIGSGNLVALW